MKKCFTINPSRSAEEISSYNKLFDKDIYQAIEIFYPFTQDEIQQLTYTKSIKKLISKYPHLEVVMHLPFGPKNNLCDFDNYQETLKTIMAGIDYANCFQVKKLSLHLGYVNQTFVRDKYLEHIVPILRTLCTHAKKYQMVVMIENMPSNNELGYSPEEIKTIIEKVAMDNLGFLLDTGHANVSDYHNHEYIILLSRYLRHLHLSDNLGNSDQHGPLGKGNINFFQIISDLKNVNYQELYCLEIIYHDYHDLKKNAFDLDKYDILDKDINQR